MGQIVVLSVGIPFWDIHVDHQLLVQDKHLDLCRKLMQIYISCNYHMPQNENVIYHVYLGSGNYS